MITKGLSSSSSSFSSSFASRNENTTLASSLQRVADQSLREAQNETNLANNELVTPQHLRTLSKQNRAAIESILYMDKTPEKITFILQNIDTVRYLQTLVTRTRTSDLTRTEDRNVLIGEWTNLIRAYGAQAQFPSALQAFCTMRDLGIPLTTYSYTALLWAAGNNRNKQAATEILEAMVETGIPATPVTYGALLQAHIRSFDFDNAYALLNKTTNMSLQTYGKAGQSLVTAQTKEYQKKEKFQDKYIDTVQYTSPTTMAAYMASTSSSSSSSSSSFDTTSIALPMPSLSTTLTSLPKDSAITKAILTSPILHTHVIVGAIHAGKYEQAWEIFYRMRELGIRPDTVTYTAMINVCAKKDEVEKALNILTEMKHNNISPTHITYNTAIHAAGRSLRLYSHAHELFYEMKSNGLAYDEYSYNAVILACSQEGDVVRAREYLTQMLRDNIQPSLYTLNTLLTVYARALKDVKKMKGYVSPSVSSGTALIQAREAVGIGKDGKQLITLDKEGKLDPGKKIHKIKRLRTEDGNSIARVIDGSTDEVIEGMLADYFGVTEKHPTMVDPEDEELENTDISKNKKLLPELSKVSLNVKSPAYQNFRKFLLANDLIDQELLDDIEEEHLKYPALTEEEEGQRAMKYEKRHQERLQKLSDEAIQLAAEEEAAVGKMKTKPAPTESKYGEGTNTKNTVDSLSSHVSQNTDTESSSSVALVDPLSANSSADILLESARKGERVSMREYLVAIEKEIMTSLYGSSSISSAKSSNAETSITEQGWISLFDKNATLGGTRVTELMDTSTIKLPQPTKEDVVAGGTGAPEDADYDAEAIDAHVRKVIAKRLSDAAARERQMLLNKQEQLSTTTASPSSLSPSMIEANTSSSPLSLSSSSSSSSVTTVTDELVNKNLETPPTVTKEEYLNHRKSVAGRILGRVLSRYANSSYADASLSPIQRKNEQTSNQKLFTKIIKTNQRLTQSTKTSTSLLDVLLALQSIKEQSKTHLTEPTIFSSPSSSSSPQSQVMHHLNTIGKQSVTGKTRLNSLALLSDRMFTGIEWLPPANPGSANHNGTSTDFSSSFLGPDGYPSGAGPRRQALLTEVTNIYTRILPNYNLIPDITTLNVVLSCLCAGKDLPGAYDFLSTEYPAYKISPDHRTFRSLLRAHIQLNEITKAENTLQTMKEIGIKPDPDCYGLVIHGLARNWRVDDALRLVRELKETNTAPLPELYAKILRKRWKEMGNTGILHPDIPEHPIGWQFRTENMRRRFDKNREMRKQMKLGIRPQLRSGMR